MSYWQSVAFIRKWKGGTKKKKKRKSHTKRMKINHRSAAVPFFKRHKPYSNSFLSLQEYAMD